MSDHYRQNGLHQANTEQQFVSDHHRHRTVCIRPIQNNLCQTITDVERSASGQYRTTICVRPSQTYNRLHQANTEQFVSDHYRHRTVCIRPIQKNNLCQTITDIERSASLSGQYIKKCLPIYRQNGNQT